MSSFATRGREDSPLTTGDDEVRALAPRSGRLCWGRRGGGGGIAFDGGRSLGGVGEDGGSGARRGRVGVVAGIRLEPAVGVKGHGRGRETGTGVGVGGDVEAEVVAGGVVVGVVVMGGVEVEGRVEEVLLLEGEVARVELGGEDAGCAVHVEGVGVVADFVDGISVRRNGRG